MKEKNGFILEAKNIKKTFITGDSKVEALKGISFCLKKGEMLAVMGGSGSGKSTLLNVLGALLIPDDGEIWLNGKKEEQYSEEPHATEIRNRHIGFIFQDFHLIPTLSVIDNILIPLVGAGKEYQLDDVINLCERLGLENRLYHLPHQLSGGEKQRVSIARALVNHPDVIFSDEATGNLDYKNSIQVMDMLVTCCSEYEASLVFVTHDNSLIHYADRIVNINAEADNV